MFLKDSNCQKEKVLNIKGISKSFGGVIAAENITFDIHCGEVFGLIGPNGAGKTTLVNMISGVYKPTKGVITTANKDITGKQPHIVSRTGIVRTFQHPRLLEECNILTNLEIGFDLAKMNNTFNSENSSLVLKELLELSGLTHLTMTDSTSKLSYGQKKLLEIIRCLISNPTLILMDEPAAGLNSSEIMYVENLINYASNKNIAVLLIEHSMDLVMNICDRLTVLNFGKQIAIGSPKEIQSNELVIEAYLGGGNS